MAVTHSTAARNAATDAVTALIGASGRLRFRLTGTVAAPGTSVANLALSATAFGASATGTATANAIASDTNAAGNATAVSTATLETSGGVVVIHCGIRRADRARLDYNRLIRAQYDIYRRLDRATDNSKRQLARGTTGSIGQLVARINTARRIARAGH